MDNCDFDPALSRAIAYEQLVANQERKRLEAQAKPFRFEDLEGKPEPEKWGPKYSKPAKPGPAIDRFPTNCASGQKYDFDAAKHRAKLKAKFTALANADRREWALGKLKSKSVGANGLTIRQVYARAMAEKRARALELEAA